jgi:hypothetical protein
LVAVLPTIVGALGLTVLLLNLTTLKIGRKAALATTLFLTALWNAISATVLVPVTQW